MKRLLHIRYRYHVARFMAYVMQNLYSGPLRRQLTSPLKSEEMGPRLRASVYTFSGEQDVVMQLLSLRSFFKNVGCPCRYTIVSDGSHTAESLAIFRALNDKVEVVEVDDFIRADLPVAVAAFMQGSPMGKKLAIEMSMPVEDGPSIYTDSDLLFFAGGHMLSELLQEPPDHVPRFMLDCKPSLDDRVLTAGDANRPPINAGFWIAWEPLDWHHVNHRLTNLVGDPIGDTEQTLVHIALHQAGARPLDPAWFVLKIDDRFQLRSRYERGPIALRHYVKGTRHLLWINAHRALQ